MTAAFITTLLGAVVALGLTSLLHRRLLISVILLSVFSFLTALLLYVAHAPDVAITEAAVGAGMTTLIFVWAVHAAGSPQRGVNSGRGRRRAGLRAAADLLLVLAVGVLLVLFLPPLEGGPALMREHLLAEGYEDTGALNLVSAIYLGYRAFDTFGETIVLLCAVSAALFFLSREP